MVTIYDIAKELNISASTVSRTFSNPGLVKEKTRRQVLEKAKEMGYQVNMVASQLRNKTSNIIALVSLQREWSWFTDGLANGVQEVAWESGYEIVLLNGNSEHMESIAMCEKMRFAGIIVASTELGRGTFYTSEIIPVVYVNRLIEEKYNILPDDRYGVGQAMEYLRKKGHTRIGFINGPESSFHSSIRYGAFLDKMREFGYEIHPEWIKTGDWRFERARLCAGEILDEKEVPTAIFAANDQMCAGVYRAVSERGMIPGKHISVVGYDDAEYSSYFSPPLTTVSMPLYEMGKKAGQMLLAQIKGEGGIKEVIIKGELIIRESVADLKK